MVNRYGLLCQTEMCRAELQGWLGLDPYVYDPMCHSVTRGKDKTNPHSRPLLRWFSVLMERNRDVYKLLTQQAFQGAVL